MRQSPTVELVYLPHPAFIELPILFTDKYDYNNNNCRSSKCVQRIYLVYTLLLYSMSAHML
jgi:hypothetical protein